MAVLPHVLLGGKTSGDARGVELRQPGALAEEFRSKHDARMRELRVDERHLSEVPSQLVGGATVTARPRASSPRPGVPRRA